MWTEKQQLAFDTLKQKLCEEPLLQRFFQTFHINYRRIRIWIEGILSYGKIGQDNPIAYTSRTLSDSERKFDTYEKEALAIVYSVQHFRLYLYGRRFTLVTNHKPLVWFQNSKDPCSRVTRWRFKLAEYAFDVVFKAGKTNDDSKYFLNFIKENDIEVNCVMKTKSTNSRKPTKSTNPTKSTKSTIQVIWNIQILSIWYKHILTKKILMASPNLR